MIKTKCNDERFVKPPWGLFLLELILTFGDVLLASTTSSSDSATMSTSVASRLSASTVTKTRSLATSTTFSPVTVV